LDYRTRVLLIAAALISLGAAAMLQPQTPASDGPALNPTLATLRKIDPYPVYSMTYKGDYRLGDYLKGGSFRSLNLAGAACTNFSALGGGAPLLGRNFDFPTNPILVLTTDPPGGYRSISVVDIAYLGFDMAHPPEGGDLRELLNSPYYVFDGMNEKGVAIAMNAIPSAHYKPFKDRVTVGELGIMRIVLDRAASLGEALEIMGSYNIEMGDPAIHYIVADRTGSAVVEYIDDEMKVIRNAAPWQVSTNFIVTGTGPAEQAECWRYTKASETLKAKNGALTNADAMDLLRATSQSNTVWSGVYDLEKLELTLTPGRKWGTELKFSLRQPPVTVINAGNRVSLNYP
jgi:hypothetical protein